jgi:hypothetical protein
VSGARQAVTMSDDEVAAFLGARGLSTCATLGPRGWPHLAPVTYVVRATGPGDAGELWVSTFAKSQKVRNLERDSRAALQVEAGESYFEFRGVAQECVAAIHRDPDTVLEVLLELASAPGVTPSERKAKLDRVRGQVPNRVAVQFHPRAQRSWDHRKLRAS